MSKKSDNAGNVFQFSTFWIALAIFILALTVTSSSQSHPSAIQQRQGLSLEVADAQIVYRDEKPSVIVNLTGRSTADFGHFTMAHRGQVVEVLVDGRVTIAPRIDEPIFNGVVWVGDFTPEQATSIARDLKTHATQLAIRTTVGAEADK